MILNPDDRFTAEHHARFTLPWRGRVGSEHFASCRGGVIQLHPHPARVLRTLADLPPPGGGGRMLPRRVRTHHPDSVSTIADRSSGAKLRARPSPPRKIQEPVASRCYHPHPRHSRSVGLDGG